MSVSRVPKPSLSEVGGANVQADEAAWGKLRGWELELTEKINMDFATSLVLDLEGKVWRVEAFFFLSFFCCAAVAGGWIWLSRHAEYVGPTPTTSLSLRQPKSLKFALLKAIGRSSHPGSLGVFHNSCEPCSLPVIPPIITLLLHMGCERSRERERERERVRALTHYFAPPSYRISCVLSAASSRVHSSGRNELRTRLSGIRPR